MKRTNLILKVLAALLQWLKKTFAGLTYEEDEFDHKNITVSLR